MIENIIEGNEVIASFLELQTKERDWDERKVYLRTSTWVLPEKLQFHSSYDWLMPVIKKLNSLMCRFAFVQNKHTTFLRGSNGYKSFDFSKEGIDVYTAFQLTVLAIKWHNSKTNHPTPKC